MSKLVSKVIFHSQSWCKILEAPEKPSATFTRLFNRLFRNFFSYFLRKSLKNSFSDFPWGFYWSTFRDSSSIYSMVFFRIRSMKLFSTITLSSPKIFTTISLANLASCNSKRSYKNSYRSPLRFIPENPLRFIPEFLKRWEVPTLICSTFAYHFHMNSF